MPLLREAGYEVGHELRNTLNALVVNLDVVRSRSDGLDRTVQPFLAQAVEQSEESVRMAEATIALLHLVLGAVSPGGTLSVAYHEGGAIGIESTDSDAERAISALQPLAARGAIAAERRGTTVILSILDSSPESKETE